jgi:N-methylhydantoinase A
MAEKRYLLAVDIGGTFTDIVALDKHTHHIFIEKVLTTYPDPSIAVLTGVHELLSHNGIEADRVEYVVHGTTLITNTLIERKGALTALLTTAGFRDALEIGNEGRYDMYDLGLVKPTPLVERQFRLDVPERITAQGDIYLPLDEEALRQICIRLKKTDIRAVAICFLHAYTNPINEERALAIVQDELPDTSVSVSHQVAPAMREYQRTSTTVANAYVQPITAQYMQRVEDGLRESGIETPLNIMLSSGGTTNVDTATQFPIRLVESGPAGGALAGVYWGEQVGFADVFAFDMGGTTAKAVLTKNGNLTITNNSEVAHVHRFKRGSGLPLLVPMIELIEIGAGGGSIARLNDLGLPTVGPESAGSSPGPAAYGLGGTQPTVTDADLILGYLNPDYFANGTIPLKQQSAIMAFESLAQSLDLSVENMAWGVHQLVNENMAAAARIHSAERGLDIQKYTMVATGGAGPVHACGVAQLLRLDTVVVPPIAGVGSAFGFFTAPISFDFTRSYVSTLDKIDLDKLNRILDTLETSGREIVENAGVPADDIHVALDVDMRYLGQGYEVRVPFPKEIIDAGTLQRLQKAFEVEYIQFYGRLSEGIPIEAVNWRIVISGPTANIGQLELENIPTDKTNQPYTTRPALSASNEPAQDTPVYKRSILNTDFYVNGPAIIEESESTTIVLPGWSVRVDASGCLILSREK